MKGEWQSAIAACQRALACSRDAINRAAALGFLEAALLQKGDVADAVTALEEGTTRIREIGCKFAVSLFAGWLSEALCLTGQVRKARDVALEGLAVGREGQAWCQTATNERALGLIDQAEGAFSEAQSHLDEALTTFVSVEARAPRSWPFAFRSTSNAPSSSLSGSGSRSRPLRPADSTCRVRLPGERRP